MQPLLAESLTPSSDVRTLTVKLRPNVRFHDGATLDAPTVATALRESLRTFMGPVFADVERVEALGADQIVIEFRQPSLFLREALEAPLQKPGSPPAGTGPFKMVPDSPTDLQSNREYYLGRPAIDVIHVETYANVRAAWAAMLRNGIDMLYEVGPEALESMKESSTVSLFTFTRRYQHVMAFNTKAAALPPAVRRALSFAVDRQSIVDGALRSYGVPSTGPIWPKYWAATGDLPHYGYDPKRAADALKAMNRVQFTCLVAPDSLDERIALEVKRQLAMVGVDMDVKGVSRDEIFALTAKGDYDAAVVEVISGPTLFRPYLVWHSDAPFNFGRLGSAAIDRALDGVRKASDEDGFRSAVVEMQRAFTDDPPALFLAWSVRARAVSKRFVVPPVESGRDVLATLRMWRPATDNRYASRN